MVRCLNDWCEKMASTQVSVQSEQGAEAEAERHLLKTARVWRIPSWGEGSSESHEVKP